MARRATAVPGHLGSLNSSEIRKAAGRYDSYRAARPPATDLLGGRLSLVIGNRWKWSRTSGRQAARVGRAEPHPAKLLPDVPTALRIPRPVGRGCHRVVRLVGPAGMPAVVKRLNKALQAALADPAANNA